MITVMFTSHVSRDWSELEFGRTTTLTAKESEPALDLDDELEDEGLEGEEDLDEDDGLEEDDDIDVEEDNEDVLDEEAV